MFSVIAVCTEMMDLKDRYTGNRHTFNHENKKNNIHLSDYQYFNRYGNKPEMKWSMLHHVNGDIGSVKKKCQICNLGHLSIAAADKEDLLKKRQNVSNNCVHNR